MYKDWVENPILITKGSVYGGITKLAIGSTPRHNIYSTDFGWGKPIGVRSGMPNKCDGKITLFPGAKEGSVDIEVCLLSETLKALEDDKEFMEASLLKVQVTQCLYLVLAHLIRSLLLSIPVQLRMYQKVVRNARWVEVPLPRGKVAIDCRWAYKVKLKAAREVERQVGGQGLQLGGGV
ncbi:hypothetical protein FXO38_03993 [Capsicum annuum]|nr:hypothetical protein FXO37_16392 [Capsicum annuum]KAF3677065.1 hypothetical protein FXO38_03993 [Capsicum annuum]